MGDKPALWEKMRALADDHVRGDELRAKADELETKATGYYSDPPTVEAKSFLGAWARARRLWCDCTGDSLI
jgi:hypothetical protein